ncbi:MAG: ACP S-malonyltransferase [Acidimicrobiaceae bacterium]
MTSTFSEDLVCLFPGQGSLASGAGLQWQESKHWNQIAIISEASGIDVATLLTTASSEEVVRTDNAQIATFALSTIGYLELLDKGIRPRYLIGHSLGEFSALVASGLLSIEDGAKLIGVRGAAMLRCATTTEGSMVALMGGEEGALENLKTLENVWIANINGTGQIVVSGSRAGLDDLMSRNKELGWKRATPLPVGGAFHSPLMSPAQDELDAALANIELRTTDSVLIANVDGNVHTSAQDWKELLSRQLTSPVQFLDATLTLPQSVTKTIEMPPSGVLTGLTKRIRTFDSQLAPSTLKELQEMDL